MAPLLHRAAIKIVTTGQKYNGPPISYCGHNESKHSEMGPVRQNPIQRTVSLFICVCTALCTIVAHNIAQNRPDSFPPYPPDDHHSSDDVYLREGGFEKQNSMYVINSVNKYFVDKMVLLCFK